MVEQKTTTTAAQQGADAHDLQSMTHLEGIRQKVFMDRYSLKDPKGQPLEFYPEQLWARVARGIAEVEKTEELQVHFPSARIGLLHWFVSHQPLSIMVFVHIKIGKLSCS